MAKKVLIVEDNDDMRELLVKALSTEKGIKVITATNGKEGMEVALKEKPHLILSDLLMPIMSGIEMVEKLRQDEWGKDVKIFILTNLEDRLKIKDAVDNGVYDYMIKSHWKMKDLRERVMEELSFIK